MNRNLREVCDVGNAVEAIANNLYFRLKLRFIIQLLEIAAATATEVRTGRLNANWRGLDDLEDRSKRDLAPQAIDLNAHYVTRCRE